MNDYGKNSVGNDDGQLGKGPVSIDLGTLNTIYHHWSDAMDYMMKKDRG